MNLESETTGITITEWDRYELRWEKTSRRWSDGVRSYSAQRSGGGVTITWTPQPTRLNMTLPGEFSRWLAGEGPPPPPIRVGDRVRSVVTSATGVVEWIGEPDKHGCNCLVRYDNNVLLDAQLHRLERA